MTFLSIAADEFERLIAPYSLEGSVVVSVSGGSDSLALTLLMQEWAISRNVKVIGITVDHELRKESAKEAVLVHQWLQQRGIEHHTLVWHHSNLTSALQQKARNARYELLYDWCVSHKVSALLTAHHLQDQWETFLMRLGKGSGLTGLCGIKSECSINGLRLIRPLLQVMPERLKKTLERFEQPFLNDPSNHQLKYTRVRMRGLLSCLSAEGISPETIEQVQKRFQLTQDYLQHQLKIVMAECVVENRIYLSFFKTLHKEIAYRLLQHLLLTTGKHIYPLPHKSLERLYDKIIKHDFVGATAGGCFLKRSKGGWIEIKAEVRPLINK